jgi:hypothetical protein
MSTDRHAATQARAVWPPEEGVFALRLVKGGWAVPARIRLTDDGQFQAEVDGETHAAHADPALAAQVATIWHSGTRITESEWRWLDSMRAWAVKHQPDHPCLHPRKVIDHRLLEPIMPRVRA